MTKVAEPNLPSIFTSNQKDLRPFDKDLITVLGGWALNLKAILDKGLSLTDNVDCAEVTFTSNATPNTEDAIAHGLGKQPTRFLLADINKGGTVYRGATAFTDTHIYVKTTVASAAVRLILL